MQYFIGFIVIVVGFVLVWKSRAITNAFGTISFAEQKMFSMGGTPTFYKLLGIACILLGFLIMGGDAQTGIENFFLNIGAGTLPN